MYLDILSHEVAATLGLLRVFQDGTGSIKVDEELVLLSQASKRDAARVGALLRPRVPDWRGAADDAALKQWWADAGSPAAASSYLAVAGGSVLVVRASGHRPSFGAVAQAALPPGPAGASSRTNLPKTQPASAAALRFHAFEKCAAAATAG